MIDGRQIVARCHFFAVNQPSTIVFRETLERGFTIDLKTLANFAVYKLGVLMAVHRRDDANLFRRAISSVIEQRLSREALIRIYLGVDGPIDSTLAGAISDFKHVLHKVVWFPRNRGLVHVLNDLIASRADEDFYFRMDPDDVSLPDRFEKQLAFMVSAPDVDILGTDILEIDLNRGVRRHVHYADTHEDARKNIARGVPVAHPTVCFRASVFTRVPGYPPVRLNEDIEMWFSCLQAGIRFGNVPEPLYEFSVSENFWKRRGVRKTWSEFMAYVRGIWRLDGVTWRYIYPMGRLLVRLAPRAVKRYAYASRLRKAKPVERTSLPH